MVHPRQLPISSLIDIVAQIQKMLWLEMDQSGERWNGDKEWDISTIEQVAEVLYFHGLRPDDQVAFGTRK